MSTIKLAIAEDHLKYREILKTLLNLEQNIDVIFVADTGADLLQKLESIEVDIVLLDYRMPIMDGLEALKQIRIKHPQIKTIINTSIQDSLIEQEFKQSGANAFLLKDADFGVLIDTIEEVHKKGYCYNDIFVENLD